MNEVFPLKLWPTYYNSGFFNVLREYDHLVAGEGPLTLVPRGDRPIEGKINRTANLNGTARIMGGTALRDWFQGTYSEGDVVSVQFETPRRLFLG